MKLEEQVTNLKLSRKLKKLGIKQESLFWWVNNAFYRWQLIYGGESDEKEVSKNKPVSAFTASELGEILKKYVPKGFTTEVSKRWGNFIKVEKNKQTHFDNGNTEANARANMIICLIEKELK